MPDPARSRLQAALEARRSLTLAEFGIEGSPNEHAERLVSMLIRMYPYPYFTAIDLLVRPREALRFCDAVRQEYRNYDLPDDVILRTLRNTTE